ncbi:hypothetical protein ACIRPT_17355 [Streptomyces sp. NPDC101227]|uniref:hypothetical protein n=1 Tax=Streptomyces sp. NPDC101227 TaxID=3366136 RepID=UPI00380DF9CE
MIAARCSGALAARIWPRPVVTGGFPARAADAAGDSVVAPHLVADRIGFHQLAASGTARRPGHRPGADAAVVTGTPDARQ